MQWDQIVQALPSSCADQPFAVGVRLGRSEGRFQNVHTHRPHGHIKLPGVDLVPVVKDKPIRLLTTDDFAELLQGPFRCGMLRDVEVGDPSCSHFHYHKDVEDLEGGSNGDKQIAGQDGLGMIAHEGHPT